MLKSVPVLFFVVPCRVLAFRPSHTSTVTATRNGKTYIPLIVISISPFFLLLAFLAIKFVYMKHRRIGTIHTPGSVRSIPTGSNFSSRTSGFGFRDKQGNRHRGLLVGYLGSPTWETNLTSKLDGATWRHEHNRRSSFGYQPHTGSAIRSAHSSSSRLTTSTVLATCSGDVDQRVLPSSSAPSRAPVPYGGSSSKVLCSVRRDSSSDFDHRCGDYGESHGVRLPGGGVPNVARRASPSSIRLVDGPSHSDQVEYSFLSGLPPNAVVPSPLMGTRDSFQLSRCSSKCHRKPVPPMPPLPLFLPFCLQNGPEAMNLQPLPAPLRLSPARKRSQGVLLPTARRS